MITEELVHRSSSLTAPPSPLPRSRNPYHVYLDSLTNAESQRSMAGCLNRIAEILLAGHSELPPEPGRLVPWGQLRYEHTTAIRARLLASNPPLSPAYFNKHLAALRRVLEEAWQLGQISTDDYTRARNVKGSKGTRLPAGRSIAGTEITALLQVCLADDSAAGTRDAALIAFLQSTGGRRAEAATARREHYDPGNRTQRIVGKRNKERELNVHEQAAVYLGRWLARDARRFGPMFSPIDRWGNVKPTHLTPAAIAQIVNKRRKQAGLPTLSPHDFRRTFIGDMLDEGVDVITVQQIVGHSSPATTSKYDRRPGAARKAAVERLAHRLPSPEDVANHEPLPHDDDRSET